MEPFQIELEMDLDHFEHSTTQQSQSCPMFPQLVQIGDREQVLIALRFSHIFPPITAVVNLEFCTNEALDQNLQSLGCTKKHFFQK